MVGDALLLLLFIHYANGKPYTIEPLWSQEREKIQVLDQVMGRWTKLLIVREQW